MGSVSAIVVGHCLPTHCFRSSLSQGILQYSFPAKGLIQYKLGLIKFGRNDVLSFLPSSNMGRRKASIYAGKGDVEKSLNTTVEIDRLIDKLRGIDERQLPKVVAENILAFDPAFWMRFAARTELCESKDDKEDFEEFASSLMSMVDRFVQKTTDEIESATDVLKAILKPITEVDEEIAWPPKDPESITLMRKELVQREQEGQLDEGFLSEVNAQLRQATSDGDKPGLVAILQKVLQLYASKVLSRRSYAFKDGQVIKAEELLETIIKVVAATTPSKIPLHLNFGAYLIVTSSVALVISVVSRIATKDNFEYRMPIEVVICTFIEDLLIKQVLLEDFMEVSYGLIPSLM